MIEFENLWWALLLLPWAALLLLVMFSNSKAVAFIRENVHLRFQKKFTRYSKVTFILHFIFLFFLGGLLIASATGPYTTSQTSESRGAREVVLMLDASFSMFAQDNYFSEKEKFTRFDAGKELLVKIVEAMPDTRFALVSFSGTSVIHSPATVDKAALVAFIKHMRIHNFDNTGSHFSKALTSAIHLTHGKKEGVSILFLSDGEIPHDDSFDESLQVLAAQKVHVHTIGIGSEDGRVLQIFDPVDLREGKSKPEVIKEVETARDDDTLEKIADETDAEYFILNDGDNTEDIIETLLEEATTSVEVMVTGKKDLSVYLTQLFLWLFLIEILLLTFNGSFKMNNATGQIAAMLIVLTSLGGCNLNIFKAHYHNENGIEDYSGGRTDSARAGFEKSAGYHIRSYIPRFNLAGNYMLEENYAEAHRLYQDVMVQQPTLLEAWFNDGWALYKWGLKERDAKGCVTERSLKLLKQSANRFYEAEEKGKKTRVGYNAWQNRLKIEELIEQVENGTEVCPPPHENPPPQNQDNQQNESNSGGEGENKDENKDNNESQGNQGGKDPSEGDPDNSEGQNEKKDGPGELTEKNKKQIEAALNRLKKRQQKEKKFGHSRAEQRHSKEGEKHSGSGGETIWW